MFLSLIFLPLLFSTINAQTYSSSCSEPFLKMLTHKMNSTHCRKLPTLGAELAWNYLGLGQNRTTTQIKILLGVPRHEGLKWLAWGVNPGPRPQMVGTRAIIGVAQTNGSMAVEKYNITAYTKLGCQLMPSDIEPHVSHMGFLNEGGYMAIFATMDGDFDVMKLNHVWQVGYDADPDTMEPKMHPSTLQNFDSAETINLTNGESSRVVDHGPHLRMVHGVLNMVGWGTLLPTGVIIARYFKEYPFNQKIWKNAHIACQIAGYVIGTTGWGIGLGLGRASRHYTFHTHRLLSILIFTFTTLQMLALRLRPKPHDEYRKYWDMYHHFLGYALLAVIGINIFHGIGIFKPNHTWKWAYIGILGALGAIALGLELYTWFKFIVTDGHCRGCHEVIKEADINKDSKTVKPPTPSANSPTSVS